MVRASYDVDGLNKVDRPLMEHQIAYFASAEDGIYAIMLTTGGGRFLRPSFLNGFNE